MIYLISPYSSEDRDTRSARSAVVDAYAAMLFKRGLKVFSPLTHSVPLHIINNEREPAPNFYLDLDIKLLESGVFDAAIVLCLPGWKESKGIERELNTIERINANSHESIKVHYAPLSEIEENIEIPAVLLASTDLPPAPDFGGFGSPISGASIRG